MRVVCPYTRLHPLADAALRELAPDALRIDVSASDFAYSELLQELWWAGEDFFVVEHDIEVNALAVEQARTCDCWWGRSVYPYSVGPPVASLGCTRFRAELLRRTIDIFNVVGRRHWGGGLDGALNDELMRRGFTPCVHEFVNHHHWMQGGVAVPQCTCGARDFRVCRCRRRHVDQCTCESLDDEV